MSELLDPRLRGDDEKMFIPTFYEAILYESVTSLYDLVLMVFYCCIDVTRNRLSLKCWLGRNLLFSLICSKGYACMVWYDQVSEDFELHH